MQGASGAIGEWRVVNPNANMSAVAKPIHFTYADTDMSDGDLRQGDIIQPSEELRSLLKEVHPHFTDDKYIAFLVLTQTCDLVRRDGQPCKSRYINLAVVRPLVDVMPTFLNSVCEKVFIGDQAVEGVYESETKQKAEQLLERILNQNAQAEGFFYLYPDAGVEITEHSVALLQVSVAVRAHEHYDRLVRARSGRLKESFQSKLGWLIGNLFSRVATQDWEPHQRNRIIAEFLAENDNVHGCTFRWVPRKRVRTAKKQGLDITHMTIDQIVKYIKQQPGRPKELAIEAVLAVIKELMPDVPATVIETLKSRLSNDSVFESACR